MDIIDGGKQMIIDYHFLNSGTVTNAYPVSSQKVLLDKLSNHDKFSKLDLQWGYNNVCIKEGDEWKGVFKMHIDVYEPLVMFFDMCNSPSTFQTIMNDIFNNMHHVIVRNSTFLHA